MSVVFREVREDLPAKQLASMWYVEWHADSKNYCYPPGTAYVGVHHDGRTVLEFIEVCQPWRRQGIAMTLLLAVIERWPNVVLTGGVTHSGKMLLAALKKRGVQLKEV